MHHGLAAVTWFQEDILSLTVSIVIKKERKKMRKTKIRKMLCGGMIIMSMAAMLVACGANKWVGVYGGTSSSGSKIEITVNKDGTVEYNDDGDVEKGT